MIRRGLYVFLVGAFIAFWEYSAQNNRLSKFLFSSPSQVTQYFLDHFGVIFNATYNTFIESLLGLLIATIFCFLTMFFCFHFPKFLEFILPIMIFSQVIPLIAFAPLLIIAFGLGIISKIIMVVVICYFPLFINFLTGYNSIPKNIGELLFVYDASTNFRIFRVNIPLALPNIFAGLKISATLSVIGAVVAEFNGAQFGLGKEIFIAAKTSESARLISSIIMTTVIGGILYGVVVLFERMCGKWYLSRNISSVPEYKM